MGCLILMNTVISFYNVRPQIVSFEGRTVKFTVELGPLGDVHHTKGFKGNWLHTVWFHMKTALLWRIALKNFTLQFLCILKPNTPLVSKTTYHSESRPQAASCKFWSLSMAREETTKRSPGRTDGQWRRLIVEQSLVDKVEKGDCLQSNTVPATPVLVFSVTKCLPTVSGKKMMFVIQPL